MMIAPYSQGNGGIVPPWLQHPPLSYSFVVQYNDYDRFWEVSDDYEGEIYHTRPTQAEAVLLGIEHARRGHTLLIVQDEVGREQRRYNFNPSA